MIFQGLWKIEFSDIIGKKERGQNMFYELAFPGNKHKAVTFSYDDGQIYDRRLVEIFNKYGVKGTFHLNSDTIGKKGGGDEFVTWDEVANMYKGHEVSCHGFTHPFPLQIPKDQMAAQMFEDKKRLEEATCYPVRGMSYPYGEFSDEFIEVASAVGMEYSRTVEDTNSFNVPWDFMRWNPTCHHNDAMKLVEKFLEPTWRGRNALFYIWGHSFEFDRENTWDMMEELVKKLAGKDNVWYATNIEIKDYLEAGRHLRTTANGKYVYNPSAITVTILTVQGKYIDIPAGATVNIE